MDKKPDEESKNVPTDDATSKPSDEALIEDPVDLVDDDPDTVTTVEDSDAIVEAEAETETPDTAEETAPAEEIEPATDQHETPPEPVAARQTEPEKPAPEKVVERVVEKRGGFFPALLGGIIAAVIGFVIGRGDALDGYLPTWLQGSESTATVQNSETIATLQSQLADLSSQIANQEPVDLSPLQSSLTDLGNKVDPLSASIDSIDSRLGDLGTQVSDVVGQVPTINDRIDALEKRPITDVLPEQAVAVYERELAQMGQSLADQRAEFDKIVAAQKEELATAVADQKAEFEKTLAEVQTREKDAEASAQVAAAGTALAQLRSALDNGAPYSAQLDTIANAGFDVADDLKTDAESGIATLSSLRESFVPAAREALAAVRTEAGSVAGDVRGFLARQLGARSVTPRDGDDPDAILSRAEAALTSGNLDQALSDVAALPDSAKTAMANWIADAEARQTAVNSADALSAQINTN